MEGVQFSEHGMKGYCEKYEAMYVCVCCVYVCVSLALDIFIH